MKIIVTITDGKKTYSEDVTDDQKEYFEEISSNSANPELTTFEHWTRELKPFPFTTIKISSYNTRVENCHFIYGWAESFILSENVPGWMSDGDVKLVISVRHE